jgi:ubiquinone/menaquinone biosynthesis C-methylase UbiE
MRSKTLVGLIQDTLACPHCLSNLTWFENGFSCDGCAREYPVINGIPDLRFARDEMKNDSVDWAQHWAQGNQDSLAQKFFSFYRKAVFSRTVGYFINRYFPVEGLLVEAGAGTSETSIRIRKSNGGRVLVALDLVIPVLEMNHSIMDIKMAGDIFHLPFQEGSIDGLWNVGVMEHFPHSEIDQIMREFRRVLKPGAPILLLWPGKSSLPQKVLRKVEKVVNFRKPAGTDEFRFHPPEISQLSSPREGQDVLERNGFSPIEIDPGFKSLMAFITVVGEKQHIGI